MSGIFVLMFLLSPLSSKKFLVEVEQTGTLEVTDEVRD